MFKTPKIAALAIIGGCLAASAASAATPTWPSSIVGTWKGLSNLSPIILTVSSEGTGKCQIISGTIQDVDTGVVGNMSGYYCPDSGAVEFLRLATDSNVPFQVYTGSLEQKPAPKKLGLLMGGVFGQYSLSYGPLGQYSFSLVN
jgi:hypothetical protein